MLSRLLLISVFYCVADKLSSVRGFCHETWGQKVNHHHGQSVLTFCLLHQWDFQDIAPRSGTL